MKNIVFRTMGGEGIGYGHYFRCISLAKGMKIRDKLSHITFIVNSGLKEIVNASGFQFIVNDSWDKDEGILREMNLDVIVLDSYLANNEYLKSLKELSKLMIFDDNNDIYDSSIPDILVNGNIHAPDLQYKKRKDALYLLGIEYLVMKEEYWTHDEEKINLKAYEDINKEGILITTGGTDPYGISCEILNSLVAINCKKEVIIGPSYSKEIIEKITSIAGEDKNINLIYKPKALKKYIQNSCITITASGSTVYEVLSQNAIPIIFSMAENQNLICKKLQEYGIAYIGKYPSIDYTRITNYIVDLVTGKVFNAVETIKGCGVSIDGQGVFRVVDKLYAIL